MCNSEDGAGSCHRAIMEILKIMPKTFLTMIGIQPGGLVQYL